MKLRRESQGHKVKQLVINILNHYWIVVDPSQYIGMF